MFERKREQKKKKKKKKKNNVKILSWHTKKINKSIEVLLYFLKNLSCFVKLFKKKSFKFRQKLFVYCLLQNTTAAAKDHSTPGERSGPNEWGNNIGMMTKSTFTVVKISQLRQKTTAGGHC